jgi:ATP-dependent DNA ligase
LRSAWAPGTSRSLYLNSTVHRPNILRLARNSLPIAGRPSKPISGPMQPRSNGYIPPCIPTRAYRVPSGPGWVHEVKHDGYRLQVRREGDKVRLSTGRDYDWSKRYPAIATAAATIKANSFRRQLELAI